VIAALERAKTKPLDRWLYAMGIRQIGESAAKELSRIFSNLIELSTSDLLTLIAERGTKETWLRENPVNPKKEPITKEESERRKGIVAHYRPRVTELNKQLSPYAVNSELGGSAAQSALNYFASNAGLHVLERLEKLGINPTSENPPPNPAEANTSTLPFTGKSFVITGTLSLDRDKFKEQIESMGGKVSGSISSKTDYLLAGEGGGSKRDKADKLKIPVLNEDQFNSLIASHETVSPSD